MSATSIDVTVRYFAAAQAAAGAGSEIVSVPADATIGDLVEALRLRSEKLARVLERCSFLCDGFAVRDTQERLETNRTVDVLPPFAGG